MTSPVIRVVAAASAIVALGVAQDARADLLGQVVPTGGTEPYCADGADFNADNTTQHVAIYGGAMYIGGCTEYGGYEDPQLEQWANLPGHPGVFGGANFALMPGAYAEYIATTPGTGHLWAVQDSGQIWLWNGTAWSAVSPPPGVMASHIAPISDTYAFVLDKNSTCPGGQCIYYTSNGGASWTELVTTVNGAVGAVGIAVDPQSGKPWIVNSSGHVLRLQSRMTILAGHLHPISWWEDQGTSGLPSGGASGAIGVYQQTPWVIAREGLGGRLFSLVSGTWVQQSNLVTLATDLAVDPSNGVVCVVSANGPDFPGQGGNNMTPAKDNLWCSNPPPPR
jgi:hypothetical protein